MGRYCPKCNGLIREGYDHCYYCGHEVRGKGRSGRETLAFVVTLAVTAILVKRYYVPSYHAVKPFLIARFYGLMRHIETLSSSSSPYDVKLRLIFVSTLMGAFGFFFLLIFLRKFR
jgi:hypothetical protein